MQFRKAQICVSSNGILEAFALSEARHPLLLLVVSFACALGAGQVKTGAVPRTWRMRHYPAPGPVFDLVAAPPTNLTAEGDPLMRRRMLPAFLSCCLCLALVRPIPAQEKLPADGRPSAQQPDLAGLEQRVKVLEATVKRLQAE